MDSLQGKHCQAAVRYFVADAAVLPEKQKENVYKIRFGGFFYTFFFAARGYSGMQSWVPIRRL